MTQLEIAGSGATTALMEQVAREESVPLAELARLMGEGLVVLPANKNHRHVRPVGIGCGLRTKVNANIGASPSRASVEEELGKLRACLDAGADTVMDLSVGGDLDRVRRAVIEHSPAPVGTVPIYQAAIESGSPEEMTLQGFLDVLERHARDGVDFVTVHAGVIREAIPLAQKRLMGVVSRGGAVLVKWMAAHGKQSFLLEHFDQVLEIARDYDVTMSLGDGLRPGCIDDATDEAQLCELEKLGELARRCRRRGVQVMIEGPGHIPLNEVAENVRLEKQHCDGAPFYVLGPLPTDLAPGYDHVVGAVGGALAGMAGADFLCYLTPTEHIGLPDEKAVREGVVVTRIAAHIADVAKGVKAARERDRQMSEARNNLDWETMRQLALDPARFGELLGDRQEGDQCSMCGRYCAIKVFKEAVAKR